MPSVTLNYRIWYESNIYVGEFPQQFRDSLEGFREFHDVS